MEQTVKANPGWYPLGQGFIPGQKGLERGADMGIA
jgi:hypothetical protein